MVLEWSFLYYFNHLTRLEARENFINFSRRESLKSYTKTNFILFFLFFYISYCISPLDVRHSASAHSMFTGFTPFSRITATTSLDSVNLLIFVTNILVHVAYSLRCGLDVQMLFRWTSGFKALINLCKLWFGIRVRSELIISTLAFIYTLLQSSNSHEC
jgi:hypothetical protein